MFTVGPLHCHSALFHFVEEKKTMSQNFCPSCSKELAGEFRFCPHCGYDMQKPIVCPNCQYANESNSKFC